MMRPFTFANYLRLVDCLFREIADVCNLGSHSIISPARTQFILDNSYFFGSNGKWHIAVYLFTLISRSHFIEDSCLLRSVICSLQALTDTSSAKQYFGSLCESQLRRCSRSQADQDPNPRSDLSTRCGPSAGRVRSSKCWSGGGGWRGRACL